MAEKIIKESVAKPIEEIIFHLGRGIALAQMELDRQSIYFQTLIEDNPDLKEKGLEATWYQIPEAFLSVKISFHIIEEIQGSIKRKKLFASPMNATYKNSYEYEVTGSSSVNLKIVPVPPPTVFEEE